MQVLKIDKHLLEDEYQRFGQARKVDVFLIIFQCQADIGDLEDVNQDGDAGEEEIAVGTIAGSLRLEIVQIFGQSTAEQEISHQIQGGGEQRDCGDHPDWRRPFQVVSRANGILE